MSVTSTTTDVDDLTLTFVTEFDAPLERVWQLWADPRLLERWWGPPTWPASFPEYDFREGGRAHYYMTGPSGDEAHGVWRITLVEPQTRIAFQDGFASSTGEYDAAHGMTGAEVSLVETEGRTTMTIVNRFESREQFDRLSEMGMEEGMRSALGQIDAILAA